ncbi:BCCT family transporter [Micromonospora peucetia]|uniref:Choline/carnitine/betaine transport n=1 Tax=Micromonospora peucetia TaxID=47871 RepID=A0A1C6W415_9ACTN|nr:BCCT family transporter [Micromonospora peucetia]MCX4390302.1 BCCT family transporter [Micromonospora peucetia]SCL73256.1 choline/carnitine/betaine transport [Micromonospora peucetia]
MTVSAAGPATDDNSPPGEVSPQPERRPQGIDRTVLGVAAAVSVLFVGWGIVATDNLASVTGTALDWVARSFGWVFVLASAGFVVLSIWLALSRYGRIKLGRDDDKPEFSTVSWVAMMFSAGMGIGLMFWGAAEPLSHLGTPPRGLNEANSQQAAREAMEYSFFHWALHPWAIYAVVGLTLAYFTFRKGRRSLISSAFFPLIGERADRGPGRAIDIFAIFATLFGSAVSLGLGALQINSGLTNLWDVPTSTPLAIGIIAVLTVAFVVSAVTGVKRGIQFLSNTNMVLAVALMFFLLVVGPTVFILNTLTASTGGYLFDLVPMSFRTGAFGGEQWMAGWTIFYWAWWISWTPFVGAFIARISKGRTIRQFVLGVVAIPSLVSIVWFSVFGGTAIDLQLNGTDLSAAVKESPEAALFAVLREFPFFTVTAILVMVLVGLFFVSGADAASVVMGTLSSRGNLEPKTWLVSMWGVLTGLVAAVLLLAGGLSALQSLTILAALPFLFVMVGMVVGLLRELRREPPEATMAPELRALVIATAPPTATTPDAS